MKVVLVFGAFMVVFTGLHGADRLTPAALLDRVIMDPGAYIQNCDAADLSKLEEPKTIRLYSTNFRDGLVYFLSKRDVDELADQRVAVTAELVARLTRLNPLRREPRRSVPTQETDPAVYEGRNPDALGPILFDVIAILDAVETLPELLRIERELDRAHAAAGKPGAAPLEVNFDADWIDYARRPVASAPADLLRRASKIEAARARLEILSLFLRVLRAQRFPPLLASKIEAEYRDTLYISLANSSYKRFKTRAEAAAAGENWISFDRIYEIPIVHYKVEVPFTPELRAEICALTERFVREVPPEKWLRDSLSAPYYSR